MTAGRLIHGCAVVIACLGCRPAAPDDHPPTACALQSISSDTLRFGVLTRSDETGDVTGTVLSFWRNDAKLWEGSLQVAAGELGGPEAFTTLRLSETTGILEYGAGQAGSERTFRGRISCDSVWGMESLFSGTDSVFRTRPRMSNRIDR